MRLRSETLVVRLVTIPICMSALAISAWTQTQGTYFTFRMEQLKEQLRVTPAQEQELKHIVEQETGELLQFVCNPSASETTNRKLNQFRQIFRASASRMRPILSTEQYRKVIELNQEMLQDWKTRKQGTACTMAYWGRTQP